MKLHYHSSASRGQANHGWLKSKHSFSFADYYNSERMHFGVLRVLNDDQVVGGAGFPTHPHSNMEIISIPLKGDLEHKDSMGNHGIIRSGEIQVMSAGTGVHHSEYNKNKNEGVEFLQIWIIPNKRDVSPRYDQKIIHDLIQPNMLTQILSPYPDDQGVWIHQDAWFYKGEYDSEKTENYHLHQEENGVYLFVIEGTVSVNGQELNKRDALGITDTASFYMNISANTELLLMEVPMHLPRI